MTSNAPTSVSSSDVVVVPLPTEDSSDRIVLDSAPSNTKNSRDSIETAATESTSLSMDDKEGKADEEEPFKPWEDDPEWVPVTKSGKQKSPGQIRNELQRYIDQCKAEGTVTQTVLVKDVMGLTYSSFSTFMNPKKYKNAWSAVENSTYWAAAKLLEDVKFEKEQAKKKKPKKTDPPKKKRKCDGEPDKASNANKKSKTSKTKAEMKTEAEELIQRILSVEGVTSENKIYDTCPQIVKKIKKFLQRDGMTKAALLKALGNRSASSMGSFLAGKKQDRCGNVIYRESYVFFEKLRILEGKPKSDARKKNEEENPSGFSTKSQRPVSQKWFFGCGY